MATDRKPRGEVLTSLAAERLKAKLIEIGFTVPFSWIEMETKLAKLAGERSIRRPSHETLEKIVEGRRCDLGPMKALFTLLELPFNDQEDTLVNPPLGRLLEPQDIRIPAVRAGLAAHNAGIPSLKKAYLDTLLAKVGTFPVEAFFHHWEEEEQRSLKHAAEVKVVEVKLQEKPSGFGPGGPEGMGGDRREVLFGTPTPAAEFVEEAIKKSRKRQVLLLAEPGEGKSTLMRKLALAYHARGLVPLFIECHDWSGVDVEEYIKETYPKRIGVSENEREATGRWLWKQVEDDKAVLLFDGLDEAEEPEAAARSLEQLRVPCRLVVTCRVAVNKNFCPTFHHAHLRPLEFEGEIKPYVEARLGEGSEKARAFLAMIHPQTGDARTAQLATSGICLAMMLFLVQDATTRFEPPVSRESLYEKLVVAVFEKPARLKGGKRTQTLAFPTELKTLALEAAAFEALFRGGAGTVPTETLYRHLQKLGAVGESCKHAAEELAAQTGLLTPTPDKKAFRFFHLTLLEWFAARYLAREWNAYWHAVKAADSPLTPAGYPLGGGDNAEFLLDSPVRVPREARVVGLGGGLGERLIGWLPAPHQPWRVTALPPEFPVGHAAHGLPPFRNLLFDPKLRETLLLLVGQMEAVEFCVAGESAGIEAWWMEQMAANDYLCDVGLQCLARCHGYHGQVGEWLLGNLRALNDLEGGHDTPGLALLGKTSGSPNQAAVVEYLLRHIRPEFEAVDTTIIEWCVTAVGRLGSADAVGTLLDCLRYEEDSGVRWRIAEALGEIGSADAVPTLLDCLRFEEDNNVRWSSANALGEIGSADAVPTLLDCLRFEKDSGVRERVADALGKIGSADAVPTLLDCLRFEKDSIEEDRDVRERVADALGKLGSADAVPTLLDCLRYEGDSIVRWRVADALGRLGSAGAVPTLLDCLRITYPGSITDALGRLDSADAVPALLNCLLFADYPNIHWRVADVLDEIGSVYVVPTLLNCLRSADYPNTDYADVRWRVADVLGSLGSADAVPTLLDCLRYEGDSIVRWRVVDALGKLGSADAVPTLLDCLRYEGDSIVRWRVADALGRLGFADAVPYLLDCLRFEKDSGVRSRIANALGKIGLDALDDVCAAWEDFEGEEAQGDLTRALYTLATFDPEEKKDHNKN